MIRIMRKNLIVTFIGGDLRQIWAANRMAEIGYTVRVSGFDCEELPEFRTEVRRFSDPEEGITGADVVILPLPYTTVNGQINAPFSVNSIDTSEIMRKLRPEQIVFVGKADERLKALAELYEVHIIDYFHREELNVLNCIPTAEGAIAIAMQETPFTLHDSRCLILGYGRIGKILARDLKGLGAKVAVSARKYSDLAWIKSEGYRAISSNELSEVIDEYDIVFNTVPAVILDFKLLSKVRDDTLVIDLASRPGGVDFDSAGELGKKVIRALSLPGKVAPHTAGEIIKETIINILHELGV